MHACTLSTYMHMHIHALSLSLSLSHAHTLIHMHKHTHTHTHTHVCMHTHRHRWYSHFLEMSSAELRTESARSDLRKICTFLKFGGAS